MNTKVKVGIAGAIVAALVALIVLDQKTTTPGGAAAAPPTPDAGGVVITPPVGGGPDAIRANRTEEVQRILDRVNNSFRSDAPPAPALPAPAPVVPAPAVPAPAPAARGEEYLIKSGDTLDLIATAHYGSRTYVSLIMEANPGLNPNALRINKKIVLPSKPEKAEKRPEETANKDLTVPAPAAPETASEVVGAKTYVIQPGDTLSGISTKVYKTSRYYDKIYQANQDRISDPHMLVVGTKLSMPDLPVRNAAATPTAQVAVSAPAVAPVAGKAHVVQTGDSLWRVAEKYAADKGLGVLDMIQELIKANPDKLKDEKTLLRLGWQLVVPE
jgi:nucleoid-associated protein YgaU